MFKQLNIYLVSDNNSNKMYECSLRCIYLNIYFAVKKGASDNDAIGEQIEIWISSIIKVLTRKEGYYPKSAEGAKATTYFQSDSICCRSTGFNRYFDQIGNQFGKVHLFPFVILCSNDDDLTSSWQRI